MTHSIIERASEQTGISVDILMGWSRPQRVCYVRFAIMEALRSRGLSLGQVARLMNRHHTTVLSGLRQAEALRDNEAYQIIRSAIA